ncbi:MAG TPA: DoxX family membrane protein [Chloroflexota bacterium]|nr:DoxX family membrane protein [Chloroflexota bacterium]
MAQTISRRTGFEEPAFARFIFSDPKTAPFWLVVRLYVGWQWLEAGWGKLSGEEPGWWGAAAGKGMSGFVSGAINNAYTAKPTVLPGYAWFLVHFVQPYTAAWSYAITAGEILVGLGLIVGLFTGVAAFFGGLMNVDYLFAGSLGTGAVNPPLFVLATALVLAWRVAGYIGLDFFALPLIGVPGRAGKLFSRRQGTIANPPPAPAG